MSRIEPGSELEDDEETARREHSYTCQSNINARGEDAKESNTKQADKSGGAAYRARVTHLRRRGAFEEGWQRTPASTQDRKHDIVRDNMKINRYQASKKQKNEDLTPTRYSSAHLDRKHVMAENVWHLGRAMRCNDRSPALLMIRLQIGRLYFKLWSL